MRNRQLRTAFVSTIFAISTIAVPLCAAEPLTNPGRHPLVVNIDKDAYNAWTELQSALASGATDDACRIVASLNENALRGLLPDSKDRDLFVSFPVMIEQIVLSEPMFVKAMIDKFEAQGMIRVRAAIERRDDRALRMAIWQFAATDAAREAHLWLGDAAMSLGHFREAEHHFQSALTDANSKRRESLFPRLTLARALGGRLNDEQLGDDAQLKNTTYRFNGTTVTAAEFDTLIKDSIRSWTPEKRTAENSPSAAPGFPVGEYTFINRAELGLADLANARPQLAGDQLFVSRTIKSTRELVRLNLSDGQVVWANQPGIHLLGDPLIWSRSLVTATLSKLENDQFSINATWIDRASGNLDATRPLFQSRDATASAHLAVNDWNAVLTVSGTICCFAADGEVRWVRRFHPSETNAGNSAHRKPIGIATSDKAYLATFEPNEIFCFNLATGHELWRQQVPDMTDFLAGSESRILFRTAAGIVSLDSRTGRTAWQFPADISIESVSGDSGNVVLRGSGEPQPSQRTLVWLDLNSGDQKGRSTIESPLREPSGWGAIFHGAGSWWTILDRPKENSILYRIMPKDAQP